MVVARPTLWVDGVGVPGMLMVLSTVTVQLPGPSRMQLTALFDVQHLFPKVHGVGWERQLGSRSGGVPPPRAPGERAAYRTR